VTGEKKQTEVFLGSDRARKRRKEGEVIEGHSMVGVTDASLEREHLN